MHSYSIKYLDSIKTFIIELYGSVKQKDIHDLYRVFQNKALEIDKSITFNIITCMDDKSHIIQNLKLIRELSDKAPYKNRINKTAGVYKNAPSTGIFGNNGIFNTLDEALEFVFPN